MRAIKKILIEKGSGKKYYVKDLNDNYHTSSGIIPAKYLRGRKAEIESSTGKKFTVIDPSFADLWENLRRGPQVMIQKDIGLIISKTGINDKSKVVDAGGGSGSLCLSLANICKLITVYEIHPEHYDIIQKNTKQFAIKNLILKQANVYDGIEEKELDLITLDLPEPWKATLHAEKSLKMGGFLIVYLPNINQVKMFIDSTKGTSIKVIETIELLERKWKIEDRIIRPEFDMLGHTGFLTFCRKS